MKNISHNLLEEPLIRVALQDGTKADCTLPEVFVHAARDDIASFPALRAHQEPMWHAFLVQLGTIALGTAGVTDPAEPDEAAWKKYLRNLTREFPEDEPWCLCAPYDRPAFLQPPHTKKLKGAKPVATPDELDVLVTAKNHDVKQARMLEADADNWIFALLSLQTQAGFDGRGNYGIVRMNGGYGNRTLLRVRPKQRFGAGVMRDIRVLLAENVCDDTKEKPLLLWLQSWNGDSRLPIKEFHPLTIEVSRLIRLYYKADDRTITAVRYTTTSARIDAGDTAGSVGDYWIPVEQTDPPKAFSVTERGFSYTIMSRLLFGDGKRSYIRPILARPHPTDDGDLELVATGLARGQGKTEGYHERRVPLPPATRKLILNEVHRIAERAQKQVADSAEIWRRVLRTALICLFQKGPDDVDWNKPSNDTLCAPWLERLDRAIDAMFFRFLSGWAECVERNEPLESAEVEWERFLADAARDVFEAAIAATPITAERRVLAQARARRAFNGALRTRFPRLFMKREHVSNEKVKEMAHAN